MFPDVNKLWEHVSRVMHFLTYDALVLILSHPLRVILRSYKWKDWVNVIFSYSCDNLSSVWRNCEFDISFTVNLSYWEKPYCSFPWPFYISFYAVNWVNLRFASDFGNTCHYNLTNYMFIAWRVSTGFVRWSQITVNDHLTCCYKCCWFISVLTIIPDDTCKVSGHTTTVVAQFCECVSLTCTNNDGIYQFPKFWCRAWFGHHGACRCLST